MAAFKGDHIHTLTAKNWDESITMIMNQVMQHVQNTESSTELLVLTEKVNLFCKRITRQLRTNKAIRVLHVPLTVSSCFTPVAECLEITCGTFKHTCFIMHFEDPGIIYHIGRSDQYLFWHSNPAYAEKFPNCLSNKLAVWYIDVQ